MWNAWKPILVGVTSPVSELWLLFACLQKRQNFPLDHGLVHGGQKIELAQKFMQVEVDLKCMENNFGGCGLSGFGDIGTFKNGQFSLSDHGL